MTPAHARERAAGVAMAVWLLLVVPAASWGQRLPEGVVPSHYDLTFRPQLEAATFSGDARIRVRLTRPTDTVVLNAHEVAVGTAEILQGTTKQTATVSADAERQQVTLRVPTPLRTGDAELVLAFTGRLNDQLSGFYLGTSGGRRYAASQMEATDARRAFPCFDEPALKATFAITMVVDARDRAISNGRVVSDTPGPAPGTHTVTFATTKRMSTYLVALIVGDFQCLEDVVAGVPLRVCALGGQHTKGRFAMEATKAYLTYFNEYYGIPYPFEKLDQIAVPDFQAGAMENTGAILYREQLLLVDEQRASLEEQQSIAGIIAHEIAHQWFGNLVTMQWWSDLWLNEGFATWASGKAAAAWKPEWPFDQHSAVQASYAVTTDSTASTRPIRSHKVETPAEIFQLFDYLSYVKAASVLGMVEAYAGPEAFRRGVRAYLARHQWGNATAEDLWEALREASGKPIDRIMAGFIDQPGTPLISLQPECVGGRGTVVVSQQRFFNDPARLAAGSPDRWTVPVCLEAPDGARTCALLSEPSQTVPVPECSPWMLGNAGASGYYVTAYPADAVRRIAAASKRLDPAERVRFATDQFALVEAGRLDAVSYLSMVEAFGPDQPYPLLLAMWGNVAYLRRLVPADLHPAYAAWIRDVLAGALTGIGLDARAGDTGEVRERRSFLLRALGFLGDDPTVRAHLAKLGETYLTDPGAVDPFLRREAVAAVARRGDAAVYDRILAAAEGARDPDVRRTLEIGLAAFETPELYARTLRRTLTPAVRTQDVPEVLFTVMAAPERRATTWAFVKEHFPALRARLGSPADTGLVNLVGYLCDPALRDDARTFFAANPIPDTERTLAQGLEQATACIELRRREESGLRAWLEARRPAAPANPAAGQARTLTPGAVVTAEVRGGTADEYALDVRSGEAVDVRVTQKGIDLVLVVQDDTGATIAEVDSPNGTEGDEPASFIAARTGTYRIRVTALDSTAGPGAYEVRAQTRAATPRDHERAAVLTAFAEARRLLGTGAERDATSAAAALKTALARARGLGEHDLARSMASAVGQSHPATLFAALGIRPLAGPVAVYASRGFEARARGLRDRLVAALDYFEARLKLRPPVALAVLARDDWEAAFGMSYGMPFSTAGARPLVVMPAEHAMFAAFAATMTQQGIPSGELARTVARTGLSLEQGLSLAADEILFHELGHVLAAHHGLAQPNRWFAEFLAGYFARAFVADAPRDPRIPVFSDVMRAWSAVQAPRYTALDDFERLYSGVGNENYGWYQGQFELRILEVHRAHGLAFLERVKAALPAGTPQSLPVVDLLARLETVAPGFQAWARALAERKPR